MDRMKPPFASSFGRRSSQHETHHGSEKMENTKQGRQSNHHHHRRNPSYIGQSEDTISSAKMAVTSGHDSVDRRRDDSLPQNMKNLSLKDVRTQSEQQERVPEGRITEGEDSTGNAVIMETKITKPQGCQSVTYTTEKIVGTGSFGVVYKATCVETGETVAVKKVLQDRRFKNRELQIMRLLDHPNIVRLQHCFASHNEADETHLHLVLDYVPDTVYRMCRQYTKNASRVPLLLIKLYIYQLCRALAYIHRMGICHRDIKPQNLLVNTKTHQLKLCDFGSAKVLVKGEPNISYICSRYYRAPELVFGATEYTTSIDVWSVGCVMAELIIGQPVFPGDSGVDQLVEIIKVLGTPTREEVNAMNPNYTDFKFPQIKPHPLCKVLKKVPSEAVDLASKLLVYNPSRRISALQALGHPFFDELRDPSTKLPDGQDLPPLFNWLSGELDRAPPELEEKLRMPA